ncbi:MAG: PDZ domain-containing protein [Fimbriiglobus sp.]
MLTWLLTMCLICAPVPKVAQDPLGHGFLGVRMSLENLSGVVLESVEPNMPAAKSGLQGGDKILEINSLKPKNYNEMVGYLSSLRPGTEVQLQIERGGEKKTYRIVLTTRPKSANLQFQFVDEP